MCISGTGALVDCVPDGRTSLGQKGTISYQWNRYWYSNGL